jgi:hypothetical protein
VEGKTLSGRKFVLAASLAIITASASAQMRQLPAQQWISNCITGEETPEARRAFTELGKPVPSHDENIKMCIEMYNRGKPNDRQVHSWAG